MHALTAVFIYTVHWSIIKALQQGVNRVQPKLAETSLAVWNSLASNSVILVVEAANLVEVIWPLVFSDGGNQVSEGTDGEEVSFPLISTMIGSLLFCLTGLILKLTTAASTFGFKLSNWERHPELNGYLWSQVILRMAVLSWPSALASSLLISNATIVAGIKEEFIQAKKFREEFVQYWNRSPSQIILLDSTVEFLLRLEGYTNNIRSQESILKAWPAILYC